MAVGIARRHIFTGQIGLLMAVSARGRPDMFKSFTRCRVNAS
jgi:hypothetical protein